MLPNPRPNLGAHGPSELPDRGELAVLQAQAVTNLSDAKELQTATSICWMAEAFWDLIQELETLQDQLAKYQDEEALFDEDDRNG